jgi:hypothetical protein
MYLNPPTLIQYEVSELKILIYFSQQNSYNSVKEPCIRITFFALHKNVYH